MSEQQEDPKYPIYRFTVEFDNKEYNTSCTQMFRECLTSNEALAHLTQFMQTVMTRERIWDNGASYTLQNLGLRVTKMAWETAGCETWCIVWFNHYTFDIGLSDEEVLASFERYVQRNIPYAMGEYESYEVYCSRVPAEKGVSLMGAQDRWRWKLCRCPDCEKRGVVTIDH